MDCKNCIHYDVCSYRINEETTMTAECPHEFKHRNQFVKLPVYIGQSVFEVHTKHKFIDNKFVVVDYELQEGKVSMIQQKADKSWKFRVSHSGYVCDYKLEELGTCIYNNLEDAEAEHDRRVKELSI